MTEKPPDEAVGYRRPPKHTRFKKGQSGNPSGRRRATEGHRPLLEAALEETISLTEEGRIVTMRQSEAMYRSLVSRAVKGDMRAAALVTKLAAQLGLSSPSGDDDEIIVRVQPFGDGDP